MQGVTPSGAALQDTAAGADAQDTVDLIQQTDFLEQARGLLDQVWWTGDWTLVLQRIGLAVLVLVVGWAVARLGARLVRRIFRPEGEEEKAGTAFAVPIVRWTVWALTLLAVLDVLGLDSAFVRGLLNLELLAVSGTVITPGLLLLVALLVTVAWGMSRLLRRTVDSGMRGRGIDEGTIAISKRLLHYTVMALGLAVALDTLGISLGALFAAGAVFAIGIGFAMQNIAQNFVSGLILLVERSIKPGDVLEVEGMVVVVQKMGIRATVGRTRDEEEIIIPNGKLVENNVKNYTLRDSLYRLRAVVGVAYESDMKQVMQVLEQAVEPIEWRFPGRDPIVLLREFGDNSVNFDVSVWISDPWGAPRALSKMHEAIWFALKDAGITIAFPQIDVHFDPPIEQAAEQATELFPRAS